MISDRLIYGKKRMNYTPKEKVKFLKRWVLFYQSSIFLIFVMIFILLFLVYQVELSRIVEDFMEELSDDGREDIPINLSELNEEEQKIAKALIDSTTDLYFNAQKSIMFTKNISKYRGEGRYPRGFNRGGKIYMKYTGDIAQMKKTLCHEFLHTFLYSDEYTHNVVRDLASKGVCY